LGRAYVPTCCAFSIAVRRFDCIICHSSPDLNSCATASPARSSRCTGAFTPFHHERTDWAASLGANYKLAAEMAVFGRISRGYSTINYIDFISDNPLTDEKRPTSVIQCELGYKHAAPRLSLFGSLIYADLSNISLFTVTIGPGNTLIYRTEFAATRTVAAEIEARLELWRGLKLGAAATLQNAVFTQYDFTRPDGSVLDFSGNTPARTPQIIVDLSPAYNRSRASVYANLRYFGKRYASARNLVEFSPYFDLLAGVSYRFRRFDLSLQALNILNELAQHRSPVTDLNAADLDSPEGTLQRASFNMPRAGRVSLTYFF
jgi:outer membrane receptor for Fe3+-dicitrate